jgi:hypothetical protein
MAHLPKQNASTGLGFRNNASYSQAERSAHIHQQIEACHLASAVLVGKGLQASSALIVYCHASVRFLTWVTAREIFIESL